MTIAAFALFWALAFYCFFNEQKHPLLYLLFGTMAFGSFAVVSPSLTGGLTFTATPIVLLMIIARTFFVKDGIATLINLASSKQYALYLFLFWLVGAFVTLFMPSFFAGNILVIPVRSEILAYGVPLAPTTQNFSQFTYITISILSVMAFSDYLRSSQLQQHVLKAVCVGGCVIVITGLLDLLSTILPLDFLLEAFRNATYTLLVSAEFSTGKRIVGLMPEASSYGAICLSFLTFIYFSRIAITCDFYREKLAPLLIVLLIVMIWLSTSSAAYVGLGFFGILAVIEWLWRSRKSQQNPLYKRGLAFQAWFINLSIITLLLLILFKPSLFDPVIEIVDRLVLQKTGTSSFEERSMWTAVSWQAFLDSYGLGVGIGSTRASNGFVVLMSSVGLLGALFYYGFLLQLFCKKATNAAPESQALMSAVKWSFVPSFMVALLIATTPDFGTFNAFRFGLILAIATAIGHNQIHNKKAKKPPQGAYD